MYFKSLAIFDVTCVSVLAIAFGLARTPSETRCGGGGQDLGAHIVGNVRGKTVWFQLAPQREAG